MNSADIKAALGPVRVKRCWTSFRVCTLDGSPVAPFVPAAEALGFRVFVNQAHEAFLYPQPRDR